MGNASKDQQLKQAGLKVTSARLKILKIFEQAQKPHLSAENIYKTLLTLGEDISFATVYRVLTQFEIAGLVERRNFEDSHCVFELNQGTHHDHLVCVSCGQVDEFIDHVIEQRQRLIAQQAGYQITEHSVVIYGYCAHCLDKKKLSEAI